MVENDNQMAQDELEKKITEAEKEAQIEEIQEEEDSSVVSEEIPSMDTAPPEREGLSRGRKIFRRILIWLVVLALAFAGGFFV